MTDDERSITRRDFLERTSAVGLGVALGGVLPTVAPHVRSVRSANEKVVVAVIGLNGRGMVHAQNFARLPNSEVAYLCDVDSSVLGRATSAMRPPNATKAIGDFRRALDDEAVDAVSIATPDHWHTPMAILAMKAGKHVYLEKPCGHNPREGELLVAAS
jgi:predicted dehydrogenase